MDGSILKRARTAQRGVTLLELLVVMAILALTASAVALNAPPSKSGAQAEAERLAARLQAALEQAATAGAPYRVALSAKGYRFERYDGAAWGEAADSPLLGARTFSEDITVALSVEEAARENIRALDRSARADDSPQWLLLEPMGMTGAAEIAFADRKGRWIVSLDHAGEIEASRAR